MLLPLETVDASGLQTLIMGRIRVVEVEVVVVVVVEEVVVVASSVDEFKIITISFFKLFSRFTSLGAEATATTNVTLV